MQILLGNTSARPGLCCCLHGLIFNMMFGSLRFAKRSRTCLGGYYGVYGPSSPPLAPWELLLPQLIRAGSFQLARFFSTPRDCCSFVEGTSKGGSTLNAMIAGITVSIPLPAEEFYTWEKRPSSSSGKRRGENTLREAKEMGGDCSFPFRGTPVSPIRSPVRQTFADNVATGSVAARLQAAPFSVAQATFTPTDSKGAVSLHRADTHAIEGDTTRQEGLGVGVFINRTSCKLSVDRGDGAHGRHAIPCSDGGGSSDSRSSTATSIGEDTTGEQDGRAVRQQGREFHGTGPLSPRSGQAVTLGVTSRCPPPPPGVGNPSVGLQYCSSHQAVMRENWRSRRLRRLEEVSAAAEAGAAVAPATEAGWRGPRGDTVAALVREGFR